MHGGLMKPGSTKAINTSTEGRPNTSLSATGLHQITFKAIYKALDKVWSLLYFPSMMKRILSLILCLTLIQSNLAYAQGGPRSLASASAAGSLAPIKGVVSPEGKPVFMDYSPDSTTKEGLRVWSELPDQKGFRHGFLRDRIITWGTGETAELKLPKAADAKAVKTIPSSWFPSRIAKTLGWAPKDYDTQKKQVEKLRQGNIGTSVQDDGSSNSNTRGGKTLMASAGVVAFFAALGLAAAYKLTTDYNNDPRAWDEFTETLSSPAGYMIFAAFVAGAGSVYLARRVTGALKITKGSAGVGTFVLSLAVGVIASTVVSDILSHKNFDSCMGFEGYKQSGTFQMNLEDCDAIAQDFDSKKLADDVLPMIVSVAIAGGIYYAGRPILTSIFQREAIKSFLERSAFSVLRFPKAGPIATGISLVGSAALFLSIYYVVDDKMGVGRFIRDLQITNFSFKSNPYGSSMKQNHNLLFDAWARLPNEIHPDIPSYFKRYKELNVKFRSVQFSKVQETYNGYLNKTNAYFLKVDLAHKFYYTILSALKKEKELNHRIVDDIFLRDIQKNLAQASKDLPDWEINDDFMVIKPQNIVEFLLTSMVCGPKTDIPYELEPGFLNSISGFFKDLNTTHPRQIVSDSKFHDLKFYPPRVTAGKDEMSSMCSTTGKINWIPFQQMFEGPGIPLQTQLVDELRAQLAPEFQTAPVAESFQKFWTENVTKATRVVEKHYRALFQRVLKDSYIPALLDETMYSCKAPSSAEKLMPLKMNFQKLGGGQTAECSPAELLRVNYGIERSLEEEIRLTLAMLTHIFQMLEGQTETSNSEDFFFTSNKILSVHDRIYKALTDLEDGSLNSQNVIVDLGAEYGALTSILTIFLNNAYTESKSNNKDQLTRLASMLLQELGNSFTELETYLKILRNFEPSPEVVISSEDALAPETELEPVKSTNYFVKGTD